MTHDPYQMHSNPYQANPYQANTYQANPFTSPFTGMQGSAINPASYWGVGQQAGQQGYAGNPGISPQQLQLAAALAAQSQMFGQSPFTNALQNPFNNVYQNPLIAAAIQREIIQNQLAVAAQQNLLNPFVAAQLTGGVGQTGVGQTYQQQPYQPMYPQLGFGGSPFGQQQQGTPFSTLPPQSWVGQGQQGQIHPLLLQSLLRGIQPNQGISPWASF